MGQREHHVQWDKQAETPHALFQMRIPVIYKSTDMLYNKKRYNAH